MMLDRRLIANFNWSVFFLVTLICVIALVNLYSASYQTGLGVFKKQLLWVVLGALGMILISFVDTKTIGRYTYHIYFASVFLLLVVLVLGKEVAGSKSWISFGSYVTIQPSEFAKIPVILALAKLYHNDFEDAPYGLRDLVKPVLLVMLPVGLVMLQPDLGTSVMILAISGSLVLFMGLRLRAVLFILAVTIGLSVPTWHFFLKDYQKERVATFLDPSRDPLGSGYNSIQSQIAIGSGKLFGKGLKRGSQAQLRFIPERHTDFAFSVLAEEWGFAGSVFLLLLYFLIILWILDTGSFAKNKFSMLVCFGVAAMFFWHVAINVGMVSGMLPVTGVPLLILSYGGSSTLTAMLGVGVVMGVRMRKFPAAKEAIAFR